MKTYELTKYMTEDLEETVDAIFKAKDLGICNDHTKRLVKYLEVLADRFEVDKKKARIAGLLHDISVIVPDHRRLEYCDFYNIDLVEEERLLPLLTHQKISRHIAETQFKIKDQEVLSAIACHTTLKENASELDKLLFLADKIEWDKSGQPTYRSLIESILEVSLNEAVYVYMKYMLDGSLLKVVHPDYQAAVDWLEDKKHQSRKRLSKRRIKVLA